MIFYFTSQLIFTFSKENEKNIELEKIVCS